jgi:hypothetical protein
LNVGDEIDCTCPRCKLVLAHTILFFNEGGGLGKVECRTCGLQHRYASSKGRRVRRPLPSPETLRPLVEGGPFPERLARLDPEGAVPYAPGGSYRPDDAIRHPVFGVGFVLRVRAGRMEVLFRGGIKTLVAGPAPPPA